MRLVEIRDLDGPNLFLLAPAVKVEWEADAADLGPAALAALGGRLEPLGLAPDEAVEGEAVLGELLADAVVALHRRAGQPDPETHWTPLETPGHLALAFGWERRRFALGVATLLAAVVAGSPVDLAAEADALPALLAAAADEDDRPLMVRDADRTVPVVGVTGTNGKTTTTRLIAHILRGTGRKVGWSSTTGVYIEGEQVLEGDYSGPAGARRVLEEPGLDAAVVETARGGILLRGLACESHDVAVMTNISADHLGLHGIHTVEGLAAVKAVVLRVVRAEGTVVLNADDPLVRGIAGGLRGRPVWVSREAANPTVLAHLRDGGRALFLRDGWMVEAEGENAWPVAEVAAIPIGWGGRAAHMLENALCAAAACRALGLGREEVAAGLLSFGTLGEHNIGRLHVYDVRGATVIVDYAHNEVGLRHLLDLADGFRGPRGRLTTVIGTAGDRTDEILRELGRMAAERSERVIVKESRRYLRGRENAAAMNVQYLAGIAAGGNPEHEVAPGEIEAFDLALARLRPGDVVAVMCQEEGAALRERASRIGREKPTG